MLTKETREQLEALQKANPDLVIPELDPNYQPKNGVGGGRRHQPNRISPEAIPVGFKQCSRCGRVLQNAAADAAAGLGEFGVDKSGKDGRKSSCRVCCTEASRESTARTRGLPYECKSDIKAVKEAFPSFDGRRMRSRPRTRLGRLRIRRPPPAAPERGPARPGLVRRLPHPTPALRSAPAKTGWSRSRQLPRVAGSLYLTPAGHPGR